MPPPSQSRRARARNTGSPAAGRRPPAPTSRCETYRGRNEMPPGGTQSRPNRARWVLAATALNRPDLAHILGSTSSLNRLGPPTATQPDRSSPVHHPRRRDSGSRGTPAASDSQDPSPSTRSGSPRSPRRPSRTSPASSASRADSYSATFTVTCDSPATWTRRSCIVPPKQKLEAADVRCTIERAGRDVRSSSSEGPGDRLGEKPRFRPDRLHDGQRWQGLCGRRGVLPRSGRPRASTRR